MASQDSLEASSLFRVDGLVALITGGGTGIGKMLTKALVQNGASKVYIVGRRLDVLQSTASSLGKNVIPIQCDVTSKDDLAKAAAFVEQDAGYLNVLVCNSGIAGPHPGNTSEETTLEQWVESNWALDFDDYTKTFAVNVSAVWFTTTAFLKLLDQGNKKRAVEQKSQVIVTSSVAAFNRKAPGGWAYGQSKAAVTSLVKHLASQLPQWGIRANCIAPGLFPSEMASPGLDHYKNKDGEIELPTHMVPFHRVGTEQEMGGTMLYLASKAGGYCNGLIHLIDGGRLGGFPATY